MGWYDFRMKAPLIILSVLLRLQSASAQTEQPKPKAQEEEDRCCCSTYEMGQCLVKVEKKADAELNRLYQQAVKALDPKDAARLRKAQRYWIEYRDANCEAEMATYEGGSIAPSISGYCRIRLTRQRTEEIKAIYLQKR